MTTCPVNSHNEWDPLEEVIVGVLDGAVHEVWDPAFAAVVPEPNLPAARRYYLEHGGKPVSEEIRAPAQAQLDGFVALLEAEGVTVRRPVPIDRSRFHATPHWVSPGGHCQANPRDVLLVLGDEIIEAPMSWRSRYFESFAYRPLLREYFARGARWTAAPKPELTPALWDLDYVRGQGYLTTEHEPVFDAADVLRCGRDLLVQRSHVTNELGIAWLRQHLGDRYRVHTVEFDDDRAYHIDATLVPLGPGRLLVNPDRPMTRIPEVLRRSGWELLTAPRTTMPRTHPLFLPFQWLCMNTLMLDQERVIVEAHEQPLIECLRRWGLRPIPCPFRACYAYGGSFHCYTLDVRRRGTLQDYF